jgi:hypothetical protein
MYGESTDLVNIIQSYPTLSISKLKCFQFRVEQRLVIMGFILNGSVSENTCAMYHTVEVGQEINMPSYMV